MYRQLLRRSPGCLQQLELHGYTGLADRQRRYATARPAATSSTRLARINASTTWRTHQRVDHPRIAVLGGGLTGLSAAHFLSRKFPNIAVDLYEKSHRLGGWVETKTVETHLGPQYLELGPQTLRPPLVTEALDLQAPHTLNAFALFHIASPPNELCERLLTVNQAMSEGLMDDPQEFEWSKMPKGHPAVKNRFIYYPDHLVRLPGPSTFGDTLGSIYAFFTEPLFKNVLSGLLHELKAPPRSESVHDESISHFFQRRFGSADIVDNIVSAVMHGIYAGDVENLSLKSIMPALWNHEAQAGTEPLLKAIVEPRRPPDHDLAVSRSMVQQLVHNRSVKYFQDSALSVMPGGLQRLIRAFEKRLRQRPNLKIKTNASIEALTYDRDADCVSITEQSPDPSRPRPRQSQYLQVVSTLPSSALAALLDRPAVTHIVPKIDSVTVMVVKLCYRHLPTSCFPRPGFGYLIPRSTGFEHNPERALGVIWNLFFDQPPSEKYAPTKEYLPQLTVMLGGHYWDSALKAGFAPPSEEEAIELARDVLRRHMGIEEKPLVATAKLNRDCIPQYKVNHTRKMLRMHEDLLDDFKGRLSVAGGSWGRGVGVNDCVAGAWELSERLAGTYGQFAQDQEPEEDELAKWRTSIPEIEPLALDDNAREGRITGLEWFPEHERAPK